MVNISGSVGYTLLKKNNKYILVLADIHSKLPYCKNGINIDTWFKKIIEQSQIIIEEVPREGVKLHELWKGSPHTQSLKNFILDNKYSSRKKSQSKDLELMDIRPYLKPFSWEIYKNSKIAFSNTLNKNVAYNKSDEITFEEYLINLNSFFLLDKRTYSLFPFIKKVHQYITKVLKDKKNKQEKSGVFNHYKYLGKVFFDFKNKFSYLKNKTIKNMVEENILEPLIKLNDLSSMIIEWYSILQTFESDKPSVIHTGLAHSERIIKYLVEYYQFEIINEGGINKIENLDKIETTVSCINLPDEIEKNLNQRDFLIIFSFFNYSVTLVIE